MFTLLKKSELWRANESWCFVSRFWYGYYDNSEETNNVEDNKETNENKEQDDNCDIFENAFWSIKMLEGISR